ncbi:MAG: T9SS type A sorting domain-containing protein [Flavobacteriales bacterium]
MSILSLLILLTLSSLATPLSGTYTINSASATGGTNFISFNAAEDSLTANGVSGPVLFLVKQGTYTEQVSFGGITGASAINTITFKADPTNTSEAMIQFNGATSTANNYVIQLNGSTYFVFDSLSISSTTGSTYGKLVNFTGANSFITFKNNTLYGSRNLNNSDNFSIFYENTGATNVSGNLTFDNNTIYGGSNAFYINSTGSAHQSNFFITNNTVMYSSDYGVYSNESSNVQVTGNYFEDDTNRNTTLHVIYLTYSDSASDVKANNIRINSSIGNTYGIRLTYTYGSLTNPVLIENNMINMYASTSNKLHYGIAIENGYYQNIYNNTVFTNSSWSSYGRPLYLSASTAALRGKTNIVNNIFYNNQGTYAIYTTTGTITYVDSLDYNIYYSTGTPFRYNNTDYATLSSLQTSSSKDINSKYGDPGFVSNTDLHLIGTLAYDAGNNSIGVTTDIDGQSRPLAPSTSVDIGADEYLPGGCPPPSALTSIETRSDSVTLSWVNGIGDISWILEYGAVGFTPGSGTVLNVSNDTAGISGLIASTCYDVYLRSICTSDSSTLVGPYNFCTPCASFSVPFLEDFTTMTSSGPPTCWKEGRGLLSTNSIITEGYSAWTADDFGNQTGLGLGAARCELRYTNIADWLISPPINIGDGTTAYQLEFDVAVTERSATTAPIGGGIALDDKIVVLISTDFGATWSTANILRQWDSTDIPNNTGELYFYNLTAAGYTGVVQIAIYTESTVNDGFDEIFIDNFKIDIPPACPSPSMLSHNSSTQNTITLNWVDGSSDFSWELEHGPAGYTPGYGTKTAVTTSSTGTITGLNPSSLYDIYLRSICLSGDSSKIIGPVRAQTLCDSVSDFCLDFDYTVDTSSLPVCWEKYINSTDVNALAISNNDPSNSFLTDYSLVMSNFFDASTVIMVSTGELNNISAGTHRLNFWSKESGSGGLSKLIVGTVSNPNDPATFTPIDTLSLSTTYSYYQIDFTSYSSTTDDRIAFLWEAKGTRDRVYIDELCWEPNVSCEKPVSGALLNIGQDSTTMNIGWNTDTAKSGYIVSYGAIGYVPGVGTELGSSTTTSNFLPITGLSPVTDYCFWIKAVCNNGDTSTWAGPYCGVTGCPDAFSRPYSQNFSSYLPLCWEEKQGVLTSSGTTFTNLTNSNWIGRQFGNQGIDFGATLQIYGSTNDEWLISPSIDFGSDPNVVRIVSFDYSLTNWNTTSLGAFDGDDSLVFIISFNNGTTWQSADILHVWDSTTSITAGRNRHNHEIRNTTGKVKFGFYGRSSFLNANNRFHIDNFYIRDTVYTQQPGIKEAVFSNYFKIFPNPNEGQFTLLNEGETKNYTLNVMDMQGRIIYAENKIFASNESKIIDISSFSKGVYLVQLVSEERTEQHRIVVR